MQNSNFLIIGVVSIVIVLGIIGFWLYQERIAKEQALLGEAPIAEEEPKSLGSEVLDKAQKQTAQKVTEEVPDTNPLGNVQSNPYRYYQNPFSN